MRSSNFSHLSDPRYGYDFVVGVTQESINATMKLFLSQLPIPVVETCYIGEFVEVLEPATPKPGEPQKKVKKLVKKWISLEDFLKRSGNVNPFTANIPTDLDDPEANPNFKAVYNAGFIMGLKAQMGIPTRSDPQNVKDLVELGADTSAVKFNLLCSEFIVCSIEEPDKRFGGKFTWNRSEQTPDNPWIYTTNVDLRLGKIPGSALQSLTPEVKEMVEKTIKNTKATAFSIQQLFLDLTSATLSSPPVLDSKITDAKLKGLLNEVFVNTYFTNMQTLGKPILGQALVPRDREMESTLTLKEFNFAVTPYVNDDGQPEVDNLTPLKKSLNTLNYLCETGDSPLPPPSRLNWNWVDVSEHTQIHGCLAISRSQMQKWLNSKLGPKTRPYIINPRLITYHSDGNITILKARLEFDRNVEPKFEIFNTGSTLFKYSNEHFTADDDRAGEGWMKNWYTMEVQYKGSSIFVQQAVKVEIYIKAGAVDNHDTVIDTIRIDRYELIINPQGGLIFSEPIVDKYEKNGVYKGRGGGLNFFSHINDVFEVVKNEMENVEATQLESIPVSELQGYVFPGNKTFVFKQAKFSEFGDLVAGITYANPN